jgi:serine/threonine-protein phosphatase 2B catalytic subunit
MHKTNPATGFPSVITIFSAPNYCDCYNNKAAILKFDNSTLNILQFNCSPHPYHLPNFMDVFAWSMPFVIEKVTEMLYYILQPSNGGESDMGLPELPDCIQRSYRESLSEEQNKAVDLASRLGQHIEGGGGSGAGGAEAEDAERDRIKKKVRSIARMARMFKTLRQENETVIRLKGVCPGHKLSPGLLLAGKDKLQSELEIFGHVQNIDSENEIRPEGHKSGPSERDFVDEDGGAD